MDEKKAFIVGVVSGVTGNAVWALLAGGAIFGVIATWVHSLTDFEQAILYTLAAVCAISGLFIGTIRYFKTRAPAHPSTPPGLRVRSEEAIIGPDPHVPHILRLSVESDHALSKKWLRFHCDGPIYSSASGFFWLGNRHGVISAGPEATALDVAFQYREFTAPGILTAELASAQLLRLVRIEMGTVFDSPQLPQSLRSPSTSMPRTRGELNAQAQHRSKPELAAAPDIAIPTNGGIERLREVYPYCAKTVQYACEYVVADLLEPSRAGRVQALIFDLLQAFVVPTCSREKSEVDSALMIPAPLASLTAAVRRMLSTYGVLVVYIERAGASILGEDKFYSSEGYAGLYRRHRECVDELRRIRRRSDIGEVAADVDSLGQLLSRSPATNLLPTPTLNASRPALAVKAFTDPLSRSWATLPHEPIDRLRSGLLKREFAVLKVTNESAKNLVGIVATCHFDQRSEEYGIWSLDTGDNFVTGGRHDASLNVGDSRLLLVARAFGEDKLWTRLAPMEQLGNVLRASGPEGVAYVDSSGEVLSLGENVMTSVRFRAEGLDQTERFRLTFNAGKPEISA